MVRGISKLVLEVEDQDRALAFWVGPMGFELVQDARYGDGRWIELRTPDQAVTVDLSPRQGARPSAAEELPTSNVVFYCADLPRTYEQLRGRGVEFPQAPVRQPFGWWSMFVDSEGNRFALTQREETMPGAGDRLRAHGTQMKRGSAEEAAPRPASRGGRRGDGDALVVEPRARYEPGSFCGVGLATSDPAAARAFYAALFGWQAEELLAGAAGSYTLLRRNGKEAAILYRQTAQARAAQAPPHWTSYISVQDADATAARAGELGGAAVFRQPFDVLDAGRVAAIQDPTGATVSLWQPRSRFGAALVDEIGEPCWNELVTPDVERAKSFYADLVGWEYEVDDSGYTMIRNDGHPTGGIRGQTAHEQGEPAHWRPYFMVESVRDALRRTEQADGWTLSPPHESVLGRLALSADPQGAAFGLLERNSLRPAWKSVPGGRKLGENTPHRADEAPDPDAGSAEAGGAPGARS